MRIKHKAYLKKEKRMVNVSAISYRHRHITYITGWDRSVPPDPYIEYANFEDIKLVTITDFGGK